MFSKWWSLALLFIGAVLLIMFPLFVGSRGGERVKNNDTLALIDLLHERHHESLSKMVQQDSSVVPRIIWHTHYQKDSIPSFVADQYDKYAQEYQRYVWDDQDAAAFLKQYYSPAVFETFRVLKGAHRADLIRYCQLYTFGGLYLDIKTLLLRPLREFVDHDVDQFSSVLSVNAGVKGDIIHHGVIACRPRHPFCLKMIQTIVELGQPLIPLDYHEIVAKAYQLIKSDCGRPLRPGKHAGASGETYYLWNESCSRFSTQACIEKKFDRYNLCCSITDEKHGDILNTRFADYPW